MDMNDIPLDDSEVFPEKYKKIAFYSDLIELLQEVRLIHGPEGLRATLSRHKKIMLFLTQYQKCAIIDMEGKLTDNLHIGE